MKKLNPFKINDKVQYRDKHLPKFARDNRIFHVLDVIGYDQVILSLADYPDFPQDYYTNIKDIKKIK